MLQFTLIRSENMAMVDNADTVIDLSALPTNVDIVAFQAIEGKVEYNDRPSLRTPFTDPSPYQPQLNSWMTALPALALVQAKQVKRDLVDSIFHHKRRLPYTYGAWQYDARDEAVTYNTMLLNGTVTTSSSAFATALNAALATIAAQINADVSLFNNYTVSQFGYGVTNNCLNLCAQNTTLAFMTSLQNARTGISICGANSPSFAIPATSYISMNDIAGATLTGNIALGYTGNITTMPLNATAPQSIPADTFYQALLGIAQRRNSLNNDRLIKQAAINNLTTVAAVAAYNAATGWSS